MTTVPNTSHPTLDLASALAVVGEFCAALNSGEVTGFTLSWQTSTTITSRVRGAFTAVEAAITLVELQDLFTPTPDAADRLATAVALILVHRANKTPPTSH